MPVVHKYFIHHFRLLTKTKMYLMCCTTQPSLKPSNKASLLFCNNWSTPPPCLYTGYLNAEYCCVLPPQFHLLGSPCSLLPSTEVLSHCPASSPREVTSDCSCGWFLHPDSCQRSLLSFWRLQPTVLGFTPAKDGERQPCRLSRPRCL